MIIIIKTIVNPILVLVIDSPSKIYNDIKVVTNIAIICPPKSNDPEERASPTGNAV
jgi:hypothetical protein